MEIEKLNFSELILLRNDIEKKVEFLLKRYDEFEQDFLEVGNCYSSGKLYFDENLVPEGNKKYSKYENEMIINPILLEKEMGEAYTYFLKLEIAELDYYLRIAPLIEDQYELKLFSLLDADSRDSENKEAANYSSFNISEALAYRKIRIEANHILAKEYKYLKRHEKTFVIDELEKKYPQLTRSGIISHLNYVESSKIQTQSKKRGENPNSIRD